jgi:hypothetical protein
LSFQPCPQAFLLIVCFFKLCAERRWSEYLKHVQMDVGHKYMFRSVEPQLPGVIIPGLSGIPPFAAIAYIKDEIGPTP